MRCAFVVKGKRCRREANPDAELCRYHVEWADGSLNPDDWPARGAVPPAQIAKPRTLKAQVAALHLSMRSAATPDIDGPPPSRCIYVVRGKRCRRKVVRGQDLCSYHLSVILGPEAPDFWAQRITKEAGRLLDEARGMHGVDDEIALLRLLIRRDIAGGATTRPLGAASKP